MISLSDKALDQLKSDSNVTKSYRVLVVGYGWGGPTFGLVRDEQKETDYKEEKEGITLLADESLIEQFGGFQVEYSSFWLTKGFFVTAKNVRSRC